MHAPIHPIQVEHEEIEALKHYYNSSNFFSRVRLIPGLLGAKIKGQNSPLLLFTLMNTSYFRFKRGDFFSTDRAQAWIYVAAI